MGARKEVDAAIALAEGLAGWADKHAVMLGSRNPVAGPYYCFTTPEPLGVVVVAAPQRAALLELVTLSTAILSAGNTMVVLAEGGRALPAIVYAACCVAAGMPGGVVNVLSGERAALLEAIVARGGVDGIAAVAPGAEEEAALRRAAVMTGTPVALLPEDETDGWAEAGGSGLLELIDAFVKTKTVWHPSAL